jgi:peptidyl-prolyl cis-trans isomerase C
MTPLSKGGRMAPMRCFLLLLLIAVGAYAPPVWSQAAAQGRVAVVNGTDISSAEYKTALQQAVAQVGEPEEDIPASRRQALKREVINNLIGRKLAFQESLQRGFKVDPESVDKALARIAARFSSAAELDDALSRNSLSRTQLRASLREDLAIRQLLEEQVMPDIQVAEEEVRSFYDNHPNLFKVPALVKASHIFIAAGPDSTREERKAAVNLLRSIQERLDQGLPFAEMAIDYSQCPSRENGGDLGYFERERMIKGFADAAFSLNPGEISDIVRTSRGYHLIMVTDRKPKMKLSFEDVREKLYWNLRYEKAAPDIKTYLQTLRESADIQIFIDL